MKIKGNGGKSLNSDPGGRRVKPAAGGSGRCVLTRWIFMRLISGGKNPLVHPAISLSMKFSSNEKFSGRNLHKTAKSHRGDLWPIWSRPNVPIVVEIEKRESLVKTVADAAICRNFSFSLCAAWQRRQSIRWQKKTKTISPPLPSAGKVSAEWNNSLHLFPFNVVQVARLSPIWISLAVRRCRVHFTLTASNSVVS